MSDASHTTNGTTSAALREARQKLRLLQTQQEIRKVEAENRVLEGYMGYTGNAWGSLVDPRDALRDPDLYGSVVGGPLPGRRDMFASSLPGVLWPIIQTEFDLDEFRAAARVLVDTNDTARGVLETLRDFLIYTGYKYQALPKPKLSADDAKLAAQLAPMIQAADDEFCALNDWPAREKETAVRVVRDGEEFTRHFLVDVDSGITLTRFVEPEQVRRPMGSPPEWSWGVHHATVDIDGESRQDIETILGYAVEYEGNTGDWQDVPAAEISHLKRNVDRTIKRGLSDFYCTQKGMTEINKLRNALRISAGLQASIPWIEQYDLARQTAVQSGVNASIDQLQPSFTRPISGQPYNFQQYPPGTVLKIGRGRTYLSSPIAGTQGNSVHIAIGQYDMRSMGARWGMPEYMIAGDASNNNYASILVAGSPFVRRIESGQSDLKAHFLKSHWLAIKNYADAGRFIVNGRRIDLATIKRLIDLHATPPQVAIANKQEEAQVDHMDLEAGVLSKQTRREKLGLDNDKEAANIKTDPIAAAPAPGGDKNPLAALMQSDPRDKPRPGGTSDVDDLPRFFPPPPRRESRRVTEVKDASGHEHAADGKFGTGGGSTSHKSDSGSGDKSKGPEQSQPSLGGGTDAAIEKHLAPEIEKMQATRQGRATIAKGKELAATAKAKIADGVQKAVAALDEESMGGLSLLSSVFKQEGAGDKAKALAAGTHQLTSLVFKCVHEEFFEQMLSDQIHAPAIAGKLAAKVAAKGVLLAQSGLLKAAVWAWNKATAREAIERIMREAKQELSDGDRKLLAALADVAGESLKDILTAAGAEGVTIDTAALVERLTMIAKGEGE